MKRIITIQDISCVGRCSLTVALPIISAAGVETCVLPTAVLSTHTAFPKFTFHDLTDEIQPISDTFSELNLGFDAIYTGYLGSFKQLELVESFIDRFGGDGKATVFIDPVMADNGVLYKGFTQEFADRMAKLCGKADLILPNLTEACFMLHEEYREEYDEEYIRGILKRLTALGAKRAALTGISPDKVSDESAKSGVLSGKAVSDNTRVGCYLYDSTTGEYSSYFNEKLPVSYHGTGDIFASAAVGAHARGKSFAEALRIATDFTLESMKKTLADEDRRFYGVNFEQALPKLIEELLCEAK